jgi:hypothetical protein
VLFLQIPAQPDTPIIVKVIEVPSYTLGDVVLAAVGIAGVLLLGAIVLGLVLGLGFIGFRLRRQRQQPSDATDHQTLHLNV